MSRGCIDHAPKPSLQEDKGEQVGLGFGEPVVQPKSPDAHRVLITYHDPPQDEPIPGVETD